MGGGNCSRSQRRPAEKTANLRRLPLRGREAGPVIGAQMPVGGAHGLRVVGVAGLAAELCVGRAAVVRIALIERIGESEFLKGQRVGDEVCTLE